MPQTVPKRPTNGAVEPTEARNAIPPASRPFSSSIARCNDMATQSACVRPADTPLCRVIACWPRSATLRKMLFLPRRSMPSSRVAALQKRRSTAFAWLMTRDCSQYFMKKMYQVPTDIIIRTMRMPLVKKSPCCQSAVRPYGFSSAAAGCSVAAGAAVGAESVAVIGAAGAAGSTGAAAGSVGVGGVAKGSAGAAPGSVGAAGSAGAVVSV